MNYPSLFGFLISIVAIFVLFFLRGKVKNPYVRSAWRCSLLFFSMYGLILVLVFLRWKYYQMQLDTFDLNSNGTIDLAEYTKDYRNVRDKVLIGTTRNFAFMTGAALSFLLAGLAFILDLINTRFQLKNNPLKI
ncbi:hypothetical protein [Zobellia uliginosa]|uniref:hypothetical protein n=1 Tax=Zobellia uliginosa TaxID=143224 RepID=UPI0026E1F1A1|nr:hypothetical protein [Zobellia uliginosa]MDO6517556.1 hypothetical protein [Zobellia uliginosa]